MPGVRLEPLRMSQRRWTITGTAEAQVASKAQVAGTGAGAMSRCSILQPIPRPVLPWRHCLPELRLKRLPVPLLRCPEV